MRFLICVALFAGVCFAEDVVQATTCELAQHPERYQHKLVEVTSDVSQGFEDFTLYDPSCKYSVWIEYGGRVGSGVIYCCGSHPKKRSKALTIDGIETKLVEDKVYRKFAAKPNSAQAHLVGRFFAKPEASLGGYGHIGCCHLFVIQQVLDFQSSK
jgi:hypothetical protein